MPEKLKHLVSVDDLSKEWIDLIFKRADIHKKYKAEPIDQILTNKIIGSLFYEPSTRTKFSFESAIYRFGGHVIGTEDASKFSSAVKGENLQDTIKVLGNYVHAIVLRHNQTGSAQKAAEISTVPIINAGDGKGEHPTQTLGDLYTIQEKKGTIDNLTIGMAGDLANGRTVHSLANGLSQFYKNVNMFLVSPPSLQMPEYIKKMLNDRNINYYEYEALDDIEPDQLDVLYMTRIQKERFKKKEDFLAVKDSCILGMDFVNKMKKDAIIMHPLPKINEIKLAVDDDSRAVYFDQANYGLFIRMAILELILS
ncbi:MAG: aspartate carbamoyltransferase [Candidatus Berkelbacteria bacterium]